MQNTTFHGAKEVAASAGISRDTLMRWLRSGKIPEPSRDRNGYRVFTERELDAIVKYATMLIPSPPRRHAHFRP